LLPLRVVDLAADREAVGDEELFAMLEASAREPVNLRTGPLGRALVVRTGHERHVVQLTLHHIVCDAWSLRLLVDELADLYDAWGAGETPSYEPGPIDYADYAVWQRQWLRSDDAQRQRRYWVTQLAQLPRVDVPADRPRPAVRTLAGAVEPFHLAGDLASAIKGLGRESGATCFVTLLAAFQVLLHRLTGAIDIAVGTPVTTRTRRDLERVVGFLLNTHVLRGNLGGDPTFREVLRRIQATALAAWAHPDLPFEQLLEEMRPARDFARNPLFDVLFTFQQGDAPRMRGTGLAWHWLQAG